MFVRALVRHHGISVKDQATLDQMAQAVDVWAEAQSKPALPHRARNQDLNKARVTFKHTGTAPATSDARRLVRYAVEFLESACPAFFDVEWRSISLSDLVLAPAVRAALKLAEQMASDENFVEAVIEAAQAVKHVEASLISSLPEPDRNLVSLSGVVPDHRASRAVHDALRYLIDYLGLLRSAVVSNAYGSQQSEMRIFKSIVPSICTFGDGKRQVVWNGLTQPTPEQAEFCINFARRFALATQSRF